MGIFKSVFFTCILLSSLFATDMHWEQILPDVTSDANGSVYPSLSSDPTTGVAVVGWVGQTTPNIYAAIYDPLTNSWGAPTTIDTPGVDEEFSEVKVAVDPTSGQALIVYINRNETAQTSSLFGSHLVGNTWSVPVNISAGDFHSREPTLVYYNGIGSVVYIEPSAFTQQQPGPMIPLPNTVNSAFFDGVSWSLPTTIESSPFNGSMYFHPDLAIDRTSGNLYLTYIKTGTPNVVKAATYNGVTWSIMPPLSSGFNADTPKIAYDPVGGFGVVVWQLLSAPNKIQGIQLGSSVVDLSNPSQNAFEPEIDLNPTTGNGFVVWSRANGSGAEIIQAKPYAGGWVMPVVDLSTTGLGSTPQIAVSEVNGTAVSVWEQTSGSSSAIVAAYFDGTLWNPPSAPLSTTNAPFAFDPQVVLNDDDHALATWLLDTGGASNFLQSSLGTVGIPIPFPPSNLTGFRTSNTFLTQQERIVVLQWTASPAPGVTYRVRRDGVIIADGLVVTTYTDHQAPGGVVTYSVTAVLGSLESTPITIVIN